MLTLFPLAQGDTVEEVMGRETTRSIGTWALSVNNYTYISIYGYAPLRTIRQRWQRANTDMAYGNKTASCSRWNTTIKLVSLWLSSGSTKGTSSLQATRSHIPKQHSHPTAWPIVEFHLNKPIPPPQTHTLTLLSTSYMARCSKRYSML